MRTPFVLLSLVVAVVAAAVGTSAAESRAVAGREVAPTGLVKDTARPSPVTSPRPSAARARPTPGPQVDDLKRRLIAVQQVLERVDENALHSPVNRQTLGALEGSVAALATEVRELATSAQVSEVQDTLEGLSERVSLTLEARDAASLAEVHSKLDEMKASRPTERGALLRMWVHNSLWELFGIKRGGDSGVSRAGMFFALLGFGFSGLRFIAYLRRNSGNQRLQQVSRSLLTGYAVLMSVAIFVLVFVPPGTTPQEEAFQDVVSRLQVDLRKLERQAALHARFDQLSEEVGRSSDVHDTILQEVAGVRAGLRDDSSVLGWLLRGAFGFVVSAAAAAVGVWVFVQLTEKS